MTAVDVIVALFCLAVFCLGGVVAMWDIDQVKAHADREERRRRADRIYADAVESCRGSRSNDDVAVAA